MILSFGSALSTVAEVSKAPVSVRTHAALLVQTWRGVRHEF